MINSRLRRIVQLVLVALIMIVGTGTGIVLDRQVIVAHAQTGTTPSTGPDLKLITEAWNTIQRAYVDPSAEQPQALTYGAIEGMVSALGDTGHSTFLTPEMVKSEQSFTQGQFEGIGAEVQSKDGHVVIVAPMDGSPALKAGLHAGDVILKVNGEDMTGVPLEQAISKILGPAGTTVTLTILDPTTGTTTDMPIVRAKITLQNVTWQRLPGSDWAHLRIAGFSQGVSRDLVQALKDMQSQGIKGIVLDLRNNPGGLLSEAVNTTSQFIASGDVLEEKDAQGRVTHVTVRPGGLGTNLPMVVLINNGSASASEIVAGAIQDAGRAKLVGETTFGTGTVLNEFPLSDGSAMMLAIEEWLTPKGRVIWHKGIAPDQAVTLPATTTTLTPEGERTMTADQLTASGDQQLLQGIELLKQAANNPSQPPAGPSNSSADLMNFPMSILSLELQAIQKLGWG